MSLDQILIGEEEVKNETERNEENIVLLTGREANRTPTQEKCE